MTEQLWVEASAPSNIALIKYMGKADARLNVATNSSLSYTLENLRTFVRIRRIPELKSESKSESKSELPSKLFSKLNSDSWSPYERADLRPIQLSEKGLTKFLGHFDFLKRQFGLCGSFEIQSANNFPSDCGLASSASSFAALTLAAHEFYLIDTQATSGASQTKKEFSRAQLAALSQMGSGSSCRSFFEPWSLWLTSGAERIELPYTSLKHQVLLCDESIKAVSSSEAHMRVLTSDMFSGRTNRAEERLKDFVSAVRNENWKSAFEICWSEFWDMHVLFQTSRPAFFYMNAATLSALQLLHNSWVTNSDGPIITMDAGSNIHLLYRPDQTAIYKKIIAEFNPIMPIWTDEGYLAKI